VIRLFRRKVVIQIRPAAAAKMHSIASNAMPRETGGLLLGWWNGHNVVIEDSTEVVDLKATSSSWVRHEHEAQERLDTALAESSASPIGYVGDWHSHPAVQGASTTDLASLRQASVQYKHPLVLAVRLPNNTLEFHAAKGGKLFRMQLITMNQEKI
jgi:integrative and conjugative element protein (TIGR02256 family)